MNNEANQRNPLEIEATTFDEVLSGTHQPVLAAFATEWSRACQVMLPILRDIAASRPEDLKVVWINTDDSPDLGLWYDIQAVPTLLYFVGGKVRGRIVGTATKEAILSKLEAISNGAAHTRRHHDA